MDKKCAQARKKRNKKQRSQAKMEEERQDERAKREVEGEGGSQEKKRKVAEQAPPSYWNWLPPELKEDIEKKALYGLIQERLDKGFREIHNEMAELPRCRLQCTVSRCFKVFKPIQLGILKLDPFSLNFRS